MREIDNWNNHTERIHGTSGTFFQPFLTGDEELSIWVTQMYRAMKLHKASETDLHDIHMFRYRIVRFAFLSPFEDLSCRVPHSGNRIRNISVSFKA